MKLHLKGNPHNIKDTIVGKVTFDKQNQGYHYIYAVGDNETEIISKYGAIISPFDKFFAFPSVNNLSGIENLSEGDIVSIDLAGNVNSLYRVNSKNNTLLVTDQCNSNCIMCSQPPKKRDDIDYLFQINSKVIDLIPIECETLGITGGEPTLLAHLLPQLLDKIKTTLPKTQIHILTNGKAFADYNYASSISEIESSNIIFGIPLYSDFYQMHDYIVQSKGSYNLTLRGLYNLASLKVRIEIRVVLHKLTIPRLVKLAKFIYRNLPFVEHVALMGLENMGYTPFNKDKLWIDPVEYKEELMEAAGYLHSCGMNVSIYNHQLCILPKELWMFTRKSISDWKNIYLEECANCDVLDKCGGFFKSNINLHSNYIKAIS